MKAHARVGQAQLQVKSGGLHRLLLFTGQVGKAVGEAVGDTESASLIMVRRRVAADHPEACRSSVIGSAQYSFGGLSVLPTHA